MNILLSQTFQYEKLFNALWETVYLTVISVVFSYLIGLPLGIVLNVTDKDGLCKNTLINKSLGFVINVVRSVPFLILMIALLPISKLLIGTSVGNGAMLIMLTLASAPYIARIVEASLKEIDKGVIQASEAMGASNLQIIFKVMLPESLPSLINGCVIATVTIIGYTAMASTIGGGGLGAYAITYGHLRFDYKVIWVSVLLCVLLVQFLQELGIFIANKMDKRNK